MQCRGTIKSGAPCSRPKGKAQLNSNYCWQHQPKENQSEQKTNTISTNIVSSKTLHKTLEPNILGKVDLYSGSLMPLSKEFYSNINKNKILKEWLLKIKVQTPFEQIEDNQIPILWTLYQKRVDDLPTPNLLEKAIEQGLDRYLFYSKKFDYDIVIGIEAEYENNYTFSKEQLIFINRVLSNFIRDNDIRKGDVLHLSKLGGYRNDGVLVYDGKKLIDLNYEIDDYGSLPIEIQISDFPIVKYFVDTIAHNSIVNFNTEGTQLKYVMTYNKSVYQYITTGKNSGYIIFTADSNYPNLWKGILPFTVEGEFDHHLLDENGDEIDFYDFLSTVKRNYNTFREMFDYAYNRHN